MIHKVDDGYVISTQAAGWVPGCYESERAAKYAFRFPNEALEAEQSRKNREAGGTGGVITFEDLQNLAYARAHPGPIG